MKKVKLWLEKNPIEQVDKIELELLFMAINIYHILSLLWDRTSHKYTKEFIIYKTQLVLETFVNSIPETFTIEEIDERIKDGRELASREGKDIKTILEIFGAEIDNSPMINYGLTVDLKICFLLNALNLIGITDEQIFEKYNN